MTIASQIKRASLDAFRHLFPETTFPESLMTVQQVKPDFEGDYTVVLFPFLKLLRQKPAALGEMVGTYLVKNTALISRFEVVGGFLNLHIRDAVWVSFLLNNVHDLHFGEQPKKDYRVMIEYSSPNTNKPLHFGHLRNIFLGAAVAEILKAAGYQVIKTNLINDRGIHICKSMVAWKQFAQNSTPETTKTKGDHFVGDYYVKFNEVYQQEIQMLVGQGMEKKQAEREAPIMKQAQELLVKWEEKEEETLRLWKKMNQWVYAGFKETYRRMAITFDKVYYESDTYLLGKEIVQEGLKNGVLFKKADGSIWIDLKDEGLDEKLLLRGDGTSVYMTQDLGTARLKYNDYNLNESIYVIADEQNYHMQALKLILQKLGEGCASGIRHLSYGMVELPSGRMKSREGTVVDADDMIDEMLKLSQHQTENAGKTEGFSHSELQDLYQTIGLGALKFYLLRVTPKKKMIFDPNESIDLHGFTATFIQYAHARICSILRKENCPLRPTSTRFQSLEQRAIALSSSEKKLTLLIEQYPDVVQSAASEYDPSLLCNYAFYLARQFNSFYDEHSVSRAENEDKKAFRLVLITMTASVLRHTMNLCGIRLPERM